jgi:hypothetical protein
VATVAINRPTGPPPTTTTFSPARSSARRTSCTATATGSITAARRSGSADGSAISVDAGTFQRPCIAPAESMKSRL